MYTKGWGDWVIGLFYRAPQANFEKFVIKTAIKAIKHKVLYPWKKPKRFWQKFKIDLVP